MYSARRSVPAVAVLFVATLGSLPAFSQSSQFLNLEARSLHNPSLSSSPIACSGNSNRSLPALHGGIPKGDNPSAPCDGSMSNAPSPAAMAVAPCNPLTQATIPCSASSDPVRDDLNTMGKHGQKILLARERVLEILQTNNACTEWYRSKDADPAATFRTLTFSLDRQGESYARKLNEPGETDVIRSPYVASVLQGEGPRATVTINENGGFFFSIANVIVDRWESGPFGFRGSHPLRVGPYAGGTFRAQVLSLLHEFGHVIDLLPTDRDDYHGKSRHNSLEVLRFCRAEVESKEAPRTFFASR
jgi:hypothetical protein